MDYENILKLANEIVTLRGWLSEAEDKFEKAVGQRHGVEPQKETAPESPLKPEEAPTVGPTPKKRAPPRRMKGSRRLKDRKWRFRRGTEGVREWRYVGASYRTIARALHIGTPDGKAAVWMTGIENRAACRLAVDYKTLKNARAVLGDLSDWYSDFSREG